MNIKKNEKTLLGFLCNMNRLSDWILKKINFNGYEEFSERKYQLYDTYNRELYNFIIEQKPEIIVCSESAYVRFNYQLKFTKNPYTAWNDFLKKFIETKKFEHFLLSTRRKKNKKIVFVFKEEEIKDAIFKLGISYNDSDIILFKTKDQWKFRFFDADLPF